MIRGIAFPFRRDETGFPAPAEDEDVIAANIIRIFLTPPGSRVMRPGDGIGARKFVFEASGPVLKAWIDFEIRRKTPAGEPRAIIIDVLVEEVVIDGKDVVRVTVFYKIGGRPFHVEVEVPR